MEDLVVEATSTNSIGRHTKATSCLRTKLAMGNFGKSNPFCLKAWSILAELALTTKGSHFLGQTRQKSHLRLKGKDLGLIVFVRTFVSMGNMVFP